MRPTSDLQRSPNMRPAVICTGANEPSKRARRRRPRRTPRPEPRKRSSVRPRPFGPHPVERGSVKVPVRDHDGGFVLAKVHPADYALGVRLPWRLDQDGYVVANVFDVERRKSTRLALHRLIARAPSALLVDHIFGNKLDCRRCALRHATPSQNTANRRGARTGRSSKYKGVTLHGCGRFQAQAKHGDKNFYLGLHVTQEAAAEAYNRKARELWGRFASLNRIPRLAGRAA